MISAVEFSLLRMLGCVLYFVYPYERLYFSFQFFEEWHWNFLFLKLCVLVDIYLHADLFSMWPPICKPEKPLDPFELGL